MDGVEGVYEGLLEDGRPCIKVALKKRSESLEKTIAELFPDCPLVFIDTGEVGPHADHGEAGLSS
jgi:hypothetical protein